MTMIQSPRIPANNKLRLAILYALRYQKLTSNAITSVVDALIENGVSADRARVSAGVSIGYGRRADDASIARQLVYVTLNLAGADQRQDDLFMNESIFSRGKSALKGLKVSPVFCHVASPADRSRRASRMSTRSIRLTSRRRSTSYSKVDSARPLTRSSKAMNTLEPSGRRISSSLCWAERHTRNPERSRYSISSLQDRHGLSLGDRLCIIPSRF